MFFDKTLTCGKILDLIATHFGIENKNNTSLGNRVIICYFQKRNTNQQQSNNNNNAKKKKKKKNENRYNFLMPTPEANWRPLP